MPRGTWRLERTQMDRSESFSNLDAEGFSRAVKASRERAHTLKHRAYSDDPTEALAHMQMVVEELVGRR